MNVAVGPPLEDAGPEDAPTEELATSDDDPPTEDATDADEPIPTELEDPAAEDGDPTDVDDDPTITEEELPATELPALLPADVAPADDDGTTALEEPPWEEDTPALLARELDPGTLLEPAAPDEELPPATDEAP